MPITAEEAKAIFEKIKENRAKLDSCDGHDFSIDVEAPSPTFRKKQCSKCGGTANALDVLWYERGVQHERNRKGDSK